MYSLTSCKAPRYCPRSSLLAASLKYAVIINLLFSIAFPILKSLLLEFKASLKFSKME
jgi:hypothetical protein